MDINEYRDQLSELSLADAGNRYKLVGLFAYNAYFDADPEKIIDVKEGLTIAPNHPISGIYLNQKYEEDTVEIDIPYFPDAARGFKLDDIMADISKTARFIEKILERQFDSENKKAEELLSNLLTQTEEGTSYPILIHVLSNMDLSEKEEFRITSSVENVNTSLKNISIKATISFGHDIEDAISANKAPFENVKDGALELDSSVNHMIFGQNAIVCNVKASSLKALWKKEGNRGLLAMNLRYYIKSKNIDDKITDSIMDNSASFWYLNNGIIVVCEDFSFKGDQLLLKNFSIVNGGQTTRMIGKTPFDNDFYVLAKIIKVDPQANNKTLFVSQIAEASNTQKPIKAKDIIANKVEQRELKESLRQLNIFVEIKRGEKADRTIYKEAWQRTRNNELAQDLFAFVFLQPGPARNNVSQILQDDKRYKKLFADHQYDPLFLKDLLFLEKAYRKYASSIASDKKGLYDPTKKGITKNGMFYFLSTIGYLLKLFYSTAFIQTMEKYNGTKKKDALRNEQAFDFPFIDENKSFDHFCSEISALFDNIYESLLKPAFLVAKEINPVLVYSNWTKTNTGFQDIVRTIDVKLAIGDIDILAMVEKVFRKDDGTLSEKANSLFAKNAKAILEEGETSLSGEDQKLQNDLMVFRMNKAGEKHISERKIMTDKALEKIVSQKPKTMADLRKIVSAETAYYLGKEILDIVLAHSI